jgi:MSHA biogenesis protein MshE
LSNGVGKTKLRIGELLIEKGVLNEDQLHTALAEQKKTGMKLGRTLIALGYVEENELLSLISHQLRIRFIDLRTVRPKPEVVKLLAETHARRLRAIVLEDRGKDLLVGMSDPVDVAAYDELARILKRRLQLAVVRETDLLKLVDRVYRRTEEISSLAVELDDDLSESAFDLASLADETTAEETPVVRLLQSLFEDGVRANASDIHIEPDESFLRIRQRIDGVLQEQVVKERRVASALVLRLKLMASLDISERRRPQDGRFNIKLENRSIDVRLSTMPVQNGESVVMRLLNQSEGSPSLDDLGMPEEARTDPGHGPDGKRKDHDAVWGAERAQPAREKDHHRGGSCRVPPVPNQPGAGQPQDRSHLCQGSARGPEAGSGHPHGR